jgi:hypothetical protein
MITKALQAMSFANYQECIRTALRYEHDAECMDEGFQFPYASERCRKAIEDISKSHKTLATEYRIMAASYQDLGLGYKQLETTSEESPSDAKEDI